MADIKLKPEVKSLFVAALRSGEYQQGDGCLKYEPSDSSPAQYCCLGVLTDLAVKAGIVKEKNQADTRLTLYVAEGDADDLRGPGWGEGYGLPDAVAEWATAENEDGDLISSSGDLNREVKTVVNDEVIRVSSLIGLNDNARYSFSQIADVIEEQF